MFVFKKCGFSNESGDVLLVCVCVCYAISNLILDRLQKCSLFYGLKHELMQNRVLHRGHLNLVLISMFRMVQTWDLIHFLSVDICLSCHTPGVASWLTGVHLLSGTLGSCTQPLQLWTFDVVIFKWKKWGAWTVQNRWAAVFSVSKIVFVKYRSYIP